MCGPFTLYAPGPHWVDSVMILQRCVVEMKMKVEFEMGVVGPHEPFLPM